MSAVQTNGTQTAELPQDVRVVLVGIDEIAQTPETSNSRLHYHRPALDELAASIRQHGVLQPILVRPAADQEPCNGTPPNSESLQPALLLLAALTDESGRTFGVREIAREKLVASAAQTFVVVVDESKLVERLGRGTLPVEVVPLLWRDTAIWLQRQVEDQVAIVSELDGDCRMPPIDHRYGGVHDNCLVLGAA